MANETERVAEDLRRIRAEVRERSLLEPPARLPDARPTLAPDPLSPPHAAEPVPTPLRPDPVPVNTGWDTASVPAHGLVARLARRLLAPFIEAQAAWNARQVQLDNRLLEYVDARLDATHGHYDRVLGEHGRRLADVDERHMILQEELVAHVHDLVKRCDLVLAESEKGRASLEFALRDLRTRLARLEERLSRE
jgi:hypothetical protein